MNTDGTDGMSWQAKRIAGAAAILLAAVAAGGGVWYFSGDSEDGTVSGPSVEQAEPGHAGIDGKFEQIAQEVPEFAGMTASAVYVTDVDAVDTEQLRESLIRADLIKRDFQLKEVKYNFLDLLAWEDSFTANLSGLDVESWGISEDRNVLNVRVIDEASRDDVLARLADLNVPDDAVSVEISGPVIVRSS